MEQVRTDIVAGFQAVSSQRLDGMPALRSVLDALRGPLAADSPGHAPLVLITLLAATGILMMLACLAAPGIASDSTWRTACGSAHSCAASTPGARVLTGGCHGSHQVAGARHAVARQVQAALDGPTLGVLCLELRAQGCQAPAGRFPVVPGLARAVDSPLWTSVTPRWGRSGAPPCRIRKCGRSTSSAQGRQATHGRTPTWISAFSAARPSRWRPP